MANNKLVNGDVLQALITELEKRSIGSLESTGSAITIKDLAGNTKDTLDVSIPSFTGATDSENGTSGLVPIPTAGKQDMALCGDATYKVLPVEGGGTGATSAISALSNLGILGAIVNASVSGRTITFTKKDNTKITIDTQDTNNGIVAALLEQNGYVKFSNGLILQWGYNPEVNVPTALTFPVSFTSNVYALTIGNFGRNQYNGNTSVYDITTQGCTIAFNARAYWIAIGV